MKKLLLASTFLTCMNVAIAAEKLTLICAVEGTKVSYLSQPTEDRFSERVQIDIEPFEAPPEQPELSFISYKITVRGPPSVSMIVFAPENGITKLVNGNSFENKSNQDIFEYRHESSDKRSMEELRIDRKSGFLEAHKLRAPESPLPGLGARTVKYTGSCKKHTSTRIFSDSV